MSGGVIVARSGACASAASNTTACLPLIPTQVQILPTVTTVVDEVQLSDVRGVKWYVALSSGGALRAFEVFATVANGVADFNVSAIIGDAVDHSLAITTSGSNISLVVQNTGGQPLIAYATRLPIPTRRASLVTGVIVTRGTVEAPASVPTTLDTINIESTAAALWFVSMTDSMNNKTSASVWLSSSLTQPVVYGVVGSNDVADMIESSATTVFGRSILLNNTTSNAYNIHFTRIPVAPKLPASCGRVTEIDAWIPDPVIAPPLSTTIVDAQAMIPGHAAVKWLVSLTDAVTNDVECYEILADHVGMTQGRFVVYGAVGGSVSATFNVSIVGMQFVLAIDNQSSSHLQVHMTRVPTLVS